MSFLNNIALCADCNQNLDIKTFRCPHCQSVKTGCLRLGLVGLATVIILFLWPKQPPVAHDILLVKHLSFKYKPGSLFYGTALNIDFTIENLNHVPVKNITLQCNELDADNKVIDAIQNTLTAIFKPLDAKSYNDFTMGGSVSNKTASVDCAIISAQPVK